jgi:hypothetical protein
MVISARRHFSLSQQRTDQSQQNKKPTFNPSTMEVLKTLWLITGILSYLCTISFATDDVDAILFRTHFVDAMVLKKIREISAVRKAPQQHHQHLKPNELPPADYELNILYDADTAPQFESLLSEGGFDVKEHEVKLTGIKLTHFTSYPNVKPVPLSKSHYQHLAYTSWWIENAKRRNWRFVSYQR